MTSRKAGGTQRIYIVFKIGCDQGASYKCIKLSKNKYSFFFFFKIRSLYVAFGCPETLYVDHFGLKLRDLLASKVLGCATPPNLTLQKIILGLVRCLSRDPKFASQHPLRKLKNTYNSSSRSSDILWLLRVSVHMCQILIKIHCKKKFKYNTQPTTTSVSKTQQQAKLPPALII